MKAEITNNGSTYCGQRMDVEFLDRAYVYGHIRGRGEKIKFSFDEVKLVFEHRWEMSIVKHRELLGIKLPAAASVKFYAALCSAIEQHCKSEIGSIEVIYDLEEKARKKYWYKNIDLLINGNDPVNIRMTGRNYSDIYDIDIEDIDIECLSCEFRGNIAKLEAMIEGSREKIRFYRYMLNLMERPRVVHKAVAGG